MIENQSFNSFNKKKEFQKQILQDTKIEICFDLYEIT